MVHGLEREYDGQIDFVYLNIDDPANDAAKREYDYTYQPYFVLLDASGQVVAKWTGPVTGAEFRGAFTSVLES